jgi:hypothetical protein
MRLIIVIQRVYKHIDSSESPTALIKLNQFDCLLNSPFI